MNERGIVVGSRIELSGDKFSINGGLEYEDLVRWLIYWDKISYTALSHQGMIISGHSDLDSSFLEQEGILSTNIVELSDLNLDCLPDADKGFTFMGIPGNHAPYYQSAARYFLSNKLAAGNSNEIWTVGQSGYENLLLPTGGYGIDLIDIKLINKLPIPIGDVPLNDLLEFKLKYQCELIRLRVALDTFRERILASIDERRALDKALIEIVDSLDDIEKAMNGVKIRTITETISLYTHNPAITFWACLGAVASTTMGIPVEVTGSASVAIPTIFKFINRTTQSNYELLNFDKDFSYAVRVRTELN